MEQQEPILDEFEVEEEVEPTKVGYQTNVKGETVDVPPLSHSRLNDFDRSPRHYLYNRKHPKTQTPATLFGSAYHCFILQNEIFKNKFCTLPPDAPKRPSSAQWNAKNPSNDSVLAMDWWRKFNNANAGKQLLDDDVMEKIKRMTDALFAHDPAREIIESFTQRESKILWKDPETGIEMKGFIDGVNPSLSADLKTCENAKPEVFIREAIKYAMDRQSALYKDARAANKMQKGDFFFIVQEKQEPHCVSVMRATNDFVSYGRQRYGTLLENVRYWIEMGMPDVGYEFRAPLGYHDLTLPSWLK